MTDKTTGNDESDPLAKRIRAVTDKVRRAGYPARNQAWFVTINSPERQFPELAGKSPEEIVDGINAHWCKDRKGGLRKGRGSVACFERGQKTQHDHVHILVYKDKDGAQPEVVVRAFPRADIEVSKARSVEEIMDYLGKTGKHADKTDTTVVQPKKMGVPIQVNPAPRRGDDATSASGPSKSELRRGRVLDAIKSGRTLDDIILDSELGPVASGMQKWAVEAAFRAAHPEPVRDVTLVWVIASPPYAKAWEQLIALLAHKFGNAWAVLRVEQWGLAPSQPALAESTKAVALKLDWQMKDYMAPGVLDEVIQVMGSSVRQPVGWRGIRASWSYAVVFSNLNPKACGLSPEIRSMVSRVVPVGRDLETELEPALEGEAMTVAEVAMMFDAKGQPEYFSSDDPDNPARYVSGDAT